MKYRFPFNCLVVLVICVFVEVVFSENCINDGLSCASLNCTVGNVPVCETQICTCGPKPNPGECYTLADCDSYWLTHHCSNKHRSCSPLGFCQCTHGNQG
ncbi:uncharacterized protein LOC128230511 [Mya arenaria]|uniref:uncharacterized protein LOC128230511 n=1 Tax=Mya arenaria TaxID=6604 RepID=UPI0022E30F1E|nr:uncharacterized protein LOC128230511 [Mya arenaria]